RDFQHRRLRVSTIGSQRTRPKQPQPKDDFAEVRFEAPFKRDLLEEEEQQDEEDEEEAVSWLGDASLPLTWTTTTTISTITTMTKTENSSKLHHQDAKDEESLVAVVVAAAVFEEEEEAVEEAEGNAGVTIIMEQLAGAAVAKSRKTI